MSEAIDLEPFPLAGVCAAYLGEILDEVTHSFIKVSVKLIGKKEIAPKALARLADKLGPCLGGGKVKATAEVNAAKTNAETEAVVVTAILFVKVPLNRPSTTSVTSNSGSGGEPSVKIRETLKTTVQRQNAAKRLGEEAELVPFAGFSGIEISTEEDLTTRDVCEYFVKPKTAKDKCSLVDYLVSSGDTEDLVGPAGTVIVHSWNAPFASLWTSLEGEIKVRDEDPSNVYVWLDLISVPQNTPFSLTGRWLTSTLCDAYGKIGSCVLVLADWMNPEPLSRIWCIWEILATIQQGVELSVIMPPAMRTTFDQKVFHDLPAVIKHTFDAIDSENAVATNKNDENQIRTNIRDSIGFEGANLVVKDRLLEWLSEFLSEIAEKTEKPNSASSSDPLATATFCFRLAKILSGAQGKHAEAETMLRRAFEYRFTMLGPDHDLTIEVEIALANVYRVQGKLSEAELKLIHVFVSKTATKGPDHDETLLAKATLCRVLVDRGNFDGAKKHCLESLEILMAKFGVKDKRTLETLVTLSQLADLALDSDGAALYLRTALEGFEAVFGVAAPQTLNIKADLAGFLAELENFEEAEALYAEASEKLTATLGASHEWTVKATTGLTVLRQIMADLGPNYTPGRFASEKAVPKSNEAHEGSTTAPSSTVGTTGGSTQTVQQPSETQQPAEPESEMPSTPVKKVSYDPNTAGSSQVFVPKPLSDLRSTRHENIKKRGKPANQAARRHLRGYLEKLPVELSQREAERQMRINGRLETEAVVKERPQRTRSMVKEGFKKLGSSLLFLKSSEPKARKSVPNMKLKPETDVAKLQKIEKNWEKRFFQLQSNLKMSSLVYWGSESDFMTGKDKTGDFALDDNHSRIFETSPFGPNCFAITGPKGRLHLRAESPEKKQEWIKVFYDALSFRHNADKAKLLQPGENHQFIEEYKDVFTGSFVNMDSLLGQHSIIINTGAPSQSKSVDDMSDDDTEGKTQ